MTHLRLERVSKRYGTVSALDGIDLEIQSGELLTLLGPSGCGKTTVLRLVAGFVAPSEGRILIEGRDVTRLVPNRRGIGMVFQNYALFPHLTVARNIAFGLEERGAPRSTISKRVAELLALVRLPDAAERFPAELSGGQQQRVALARAIAYAPKVLLMDEPLGALDLKLREIMQIEIRDIQRELGITTLYVTHDQTEAMRISDRIAVMHAGRIEQLGLPSEIYRDPATRFVADFLGRINLFPGRLVSVAGDKVLVRLGIADLHLPRRVNVAAGVEVTLGIRPDAISIGFDREQVVSLRGKLVERAFLGSFTELRVRLSDGSLLLAEVKPDGYPGEIGQEITLGWSAADCKLFTR